MMNYEWRKAIEAMRKEGYAVCVITPEELKGVDPNDVQESMHEEANLYIEEWNDDN